MKYLGETSLPQSAKANRDRLFVDRAAILDEEAKKANAVRQNMARLRELRLAKQAETVQTEVATENQPAKVKPKKRLR
jgi:hypothetical protein